MKFICSVFSTTLTFLCLISLALSMEHTSLRQSKSLGITKVGLFVEGFTPESVFRTKATIKAGLEEVEIVDLMLNDLKSMASGSTDIKLFVAPSEASEGLANIVKEGMGIISELVSRGSLLFSQMDSSSPLCKEFDYDGVKTSNNPFIYNGLCVGPITNEGPMETECRAITTHVDSRVKMVTYNNLFVHRGFYFVDAEKKPNCRILGSATPRKNSQDLIEFRRNTDAVALIVACKHGNGAAILSGLQLDQNASFLGRYVERHPDQEHVKKVSEHLSEISEFTSSLMHMMAMLKFTASQD
ncbi:Biotin-protein ligase N-terminal domain containing protein [Cryptosporidium felis]|nr:Biotin-protein ligase N-terminal domain containing protein [Cryptosporidium felis]